MILSFHDGDGGSRVGVGGGGLDFSHVELGMGMSDSQADTVLQQLKKKQTNATLPFTSVLKTSLNVKFRYLHAGVSHRDGAHPKPELGCLAAPPL